ncbi:MAG: hypothetical protein B6244_11890 [Candidatus Cloacimonetes bacterium 4572_55]|nr:MAG: hypothetical protein B6244_11890 [Candidatus Cloacimonetes bacterium 4572_55]
MKLIKKIIKGILRFILQYFAPPDFFTERHAIPVLFKYFFWQRVLRINGHVDWPVHWSSVVKAPEKIVHNESNPGMSHWVYIDGRNGIVIGENTWVASHVNMISRNHDLTDYNKFMDGPPIRIGRDCWITTGVTITAGVELGDHVIVAAGSVVTRSFPSDVMIGGVPAKIIKKLEPYQGSMEYNRMR